MGGIGTADKRIFQGGRGCFGHAIGIDAAIGHRAVLDGKETFDAAKGEAGRKGVGKIHRAAVQPGITAEKGRVVCDALGVLGRKQCYIRVLPLRRSVGAVAGGKGGQKRFAEGLGGDLVGQSVEIYHAGAHGGNAFGLQFFFGNIEEFRHSSGVGRDQNTTVVTAVLPLAVGSLDRIKSVARKFSPIGYCQIIAPRYERLHAKGEQSLSDDRKLFWHRVKAFMGGKGKIQIADVMIDRSAAGETSGDFAAVGQKIGNATFFPDVLISSDDDGIGVLP